MSDPPTNASTDWRRQQRRGRGSRSSDRPRRGEHGPSRGTPVESPEEEVSDLPEGQAVPSRTLYSFIEPALDAIGSYAAPIVIAGIVGLIVGIVLVAFVGSLRPYGYVIIGFGAVLLAVITLIYLSTVLAAFLSRTGRYGVNSLIMLGAFLGILIVVNLVAFGNHSRIDVTATQQFSLATSTRNLLRDLDEPIKATAFYQDDPLQQQEEQILRRVKVEDTLAEFKTRSRNFNYEFLDPDLNPEIARDYGVTQYESIVVEGQQSGVTDIIRPTDAVYSQLEQDLYTGILVATGQERKKIYFLVGHGEKSLSSSSGDGYQSIRNGLEQDNYQVETLRWSPTDEDLKVPEDAALLVVAGPTGELPDAHARVLDAYLRSRNPDGTERREGPRLIFLAEPDTHESFRSFLASWGIVVDEGYIRDLDRSVPGSPHTLRVEAYNPEAPSEIVRPRGNPLAVSFMPGAAPIRPISDGGARVPVPLAASSNNSFLIEDIDRTDPITDAGEQSDPSGLFVTALYVQAVGPLGTPPPTSQPPDNQIAGIVAFGDSDFISNSFVDRGSGPAMFLNSANYLLGDFSLVSIRDRQFVFREFNLDQNQFNFVRFSSWFFLPGLMGLMAALVWWVRR